MNPLFTLIQKIFHVNRFDMILWSMYGWVGFTLIGGFGGATYFAMQGLYVGTIAPIAVVLMGVFFRFTLIEMIKPELIMASIDFEESRRFVPSEFLLGFIQLMTTARIGCVPVVSLTILKDLYIPPVYESPLLVNIIMGISLLFLYATAHLWNVDDIDPKDRDHLLDEDHAHDTV